MVLSVERAGVTVAHHKNVRAEIDILAHLGINGVLSVADDVAELYPVSLRGDFVVVLFGGIDVHGAVVVDENGSIEVIAKGEGVIMVLIVFAVHDVLCDKGWHAAEDCLAGVGVA